MRLYSPASFGPIVSRSVIKGKRSVMAVDMHAEKVSLSMNQNRLRGSVASRHQLGAIAREQAQPMPSGDTSAPASLSAASCGLSTALFRAAIFSLQPPFPTPPLSFLLPHGEADLHHRIAAYGQAAVTPGADTNANSVSVGGGSTPSYALSTSPAVIAPSSVPGWSSLGRPNAPSTPSHPQRCAIASSSAQRTERSQHSPLVCSRSSPPKAVPSSLCRRK